LLIYVGLHRGTEFDQVFRHFKKSIAFEANPSLANTARHKYMLYRPDVEIVHAAAASSSGFIELNISNNDGASSSLGNFDKEWNHAEIHMNKSVKVPAINLGEFLQMRKIQEISLYISDIQGMDYTVLETLKPWIKSKKISKIICEATKDGKRNIYKDLPSNEFNKFQSFFQENYQLLGTGWGLVKEGEFNEVPDDWWEFDCLWAPKKESP